MIKERIREDMKAAMRAHDAPSEHDSSPSCRSEAARNR